VNIPGKRAVCGVQTVFHIQTMQVSSVSKIMSMKREHHCKVEVMKLMNLKRRGIILTQILMMERNLDLEMMMMMKRKI